MQRIALSERYNQTSHDNARNYVDLDQDSVQDCVSQQIDEEQEPFLQNNSQYINKYELGMLNVLQTWLTLINNFISLNYTKLLLKFVRTNLNEDRT